MHTYHDYLLCIIPAYNKYSSIECSEHRLRDILPIHSANRKSDGYIRIIT